MLGPVDGDRCPRLEHRPEAIGADGVLKHADALADVESVEVGLGARVVEPSPDDAALTVAQDRGISGAGQPGLEFVEHRSGTDEQRAGGVHFDGNEPLEAAFGADPGEVGQRRHDAAMSGRTSTSSFPGPITHLLER